MNGTKMRRVAWILSLVLLVALTAMLCALSTGAEEMCAHDEYENGFCTHPGCDATESAEPNAEGVYEISNAGQLYYFAQMIASKNPDIEVSAVLTSNITVNADLLDENGLPRENARAWDVPGKDAAVTKVTLNGNGHYISGLYAKYDDAEYTFAAGLFGNASEVTIRNLGIEDSYFYSYKGNVGGLIARAENDCVITNCYTQGVFEAEGGSFCGGLVGALENDPENYVGNSYTTAPAIFGFVDNELPAEAIENCHLLDTSDATAAQELVDILSALNEAWVLSCHSDLPALDNYHVYAAVCDTDCRKCEQVTRPDAVPHTYTYCNDALCAVCRRGKRTPLDHAVTSKCIDTSCINCGAAVAATEKHTYSNGCDTTCVCGYRRVAEHIYAASCSTRCSYCNAMRIDVAEHVYDNSCDITCNNGCGTTRTITHTYDHACDTVCNVCGKERTIEHTFGEYVVTKAATALKNGEKQRSCSVCGHTETLAIERLGVATWVIVVSGIAVGLVLSLGGFSIYWFAIKKRSFAELFGKEKKDDLDSKNEESTDDTEINE